MLFSKYKIFLSDINNTYIIQLREIDKHSLTHCGLVTPYGDINLGHLNKI